MRERLFKALAQCSADYADIRVEHEWHTQVLYQRTDLENLELSVCMRCLVHAAGWPF